MAVGRPDDRQRLWQTIGFLPFVVIVFMVTTIRDEVRALCDDGWDRPIRAAHPLSTAEQVNAVAAMVVAQAIQVAPSPPGRERAWMCTKSRSVVRRHALSCS